MKSTSLVCTILLSCLAILAGCSVRATSLPEKTIETYFDGYRRGDAALIESTMYEPGEISPLGLGLEEEYRIIEKLLVLESTHFNTQAGDIEIRTYRRIKSPKGLVQMLADFRLRKINDEWKIIGYAASPTDSLPPD